MNNNINNYPEVIIKKGTKLYNGINYPTNSCPPKYKYKNINNYNKYILYTSSNRNSAKGYAQNCISNKYGWIREYRVKEDIILPDISEDQLHYEVEEVKKFFCDKGGYYLAWRKINNSVIEEIVLCNPQKYLEHIRNHKCIGHSINSNNNTICNYN